MCFAWSARLAGRLIRSTELVSQSSGIFSSLSMERPPCRPFPPIRTIYRPSTHWPVYRFIFQNAECSLELRCAQRHLVQFPAMNVYCRLRSRSILLSIAYTIDGMQFGTHQQPHTETNKRPRPFGWDEIDKIQLRQLCNGYGNNNGNCIGINCKHYENLSSASECT